MRTKITSGTMPEELKARAHMKLATLKKKVAALRERVGILQTVAYDSATMTEGQEAAFWDFAEGQLNDAWEALSNLEEEITAREKDPSRAAPR